MSKTQIPTGGIADDAISEEHLDATAITGTTALAATPDATDEVLISDGGTLKRLDFSHLNNSGWVKVHSITASDIHAFVVDDPDIILKAAICSSGTTMATLGRTAIGNKASIISNTLNTTNGASKLAINNSVATTSTLPFQIIDVVDTTATGSDTFQEVLVIYSTHTDNGSNVFIGGHAYRNPVGL